MVTLRDGELVTGCGYAQLVAIECRVHRNAHGQEHVPIVIAAIILNLFGKSREIHSGRGT
jgi:hypothetical protein